MSTMFFANNVAAQCPPGWGQSYIIRPYPGVPNCEVIFICCYNFWRLTGPATPPYNNTDQLVVIIQDIEYLGCEGSNQIVLQEYFDDIASFIRRANEFPVTEPCLYPDGTPRMDLPTILRFYAGDCRTQPIHVGQRTDYDSQGNPYIRQVYVSKNCSENSQNCVAEFTVCLDAQGNHIYTRVASSPPPQTVCGTTTVYCGYPACFPPGEITVQCNPFCF